VVHVLGVDEDLERAAQLVFGALIEYHVVNGDVEGVLGERGLDLVGGAEQHLGALELFGKVDDLILFTLLDRCRDGCCLLFLFDDVVADDLFCDFNCHCLVLLSNPLEFPVITFF